MVRAEDNSAHIMDRVAAHRRAVYAILHGGSARGHRANPAASLRVEKVFCLSVLLSGMAGIMLTNKEEKLLDQHYKVHLQRLLKLHQATPAPVVYFLAGSLPFIALLHLRIFSLFGQLCRLRHGENILATQALNVLSSANGSSKSWFWKLRQLSLQYKLPHPSTWLTGQLSKAKVKTMARNAVHEYWRKELQTKAGTLKSLCYIKTGFMSLVVTHPSTQPVSLLPGRSRRR